MKGLIKSVLCRRLEVFNCREDRSQIETAAAQIMARTLDGYHFGQRRDQRDGLTQLGRRPKRVDGAGDKDAGCLEAREMLDAAPLRAAWRVQGIGEQQQSLDQAR